MGGWREREWDGERDGQLKKFIAIGGFACIQTTSYGFEKRRKKPFIGRPCICVCVFCICLLE